MTADLPVHNVLAELRQALHSSRRAVFTAPPGSGKTTVVPLALRDETWLAGQNILILEPRRLAARLTALFMAEQLGEDIGRTVGYRVRFDSKVSRETRVEVVTEGILSRRLQSDPELTGVGLVIFDEFHERSLDSDLALALCLDIQAGLREDLRLLVMSATIDTAAVSRLLGQAPVINGTGTLYPVTVQHLAPAAHTDSSRPDHIAINTAQAVARVLTEQEGDILVFLPGGGEIRRAASRLAPLAREHNLALFPLYGNLPLAEQARAVRPDFQGRRRIILATTIAETSITIEGIRTVIDCGWKRVPRFDPNSGLSRLTTTRISRAAADQRAGRAGRLGPGACYRLWNPGGEHSLAAFDRPEILEADMASLVLELAAWGVTEPSTLAWLDPPPPGACAQARDLLTHLDSLDGHGRITALGKKMTCLPLHPRLAHMVLQAAPGPAQKLACDLAALLSERDILTGRARSVDIEERLHALEVFRRNGPDAAHALGADPGGCQRVDRISRQLIRLIAAPAPKKQRESSASTTQPGSLVALAFPDRLGQLRTDARGRYKLSSGRGALLPEHDPLAASPYLAVADLDAGQKEGRIFLAAALSKNEIQTLFGPHLTKVKEIVWDQKNAAVSARKLTCLGALILSEQMIRNPDAEAVQQALLKGIRTMGLACLPWTEMARSLQARIESLRIWQPAANWPNLSDAQLGNSLQDWLGPFLGGIKNKEQLQKINLLEILRNHLGWALCNRLDQEAPTHIQVPSGSRIKLQYDNQGAPPILAVRLQEMFGLAETPALAGGTVPVLLHLLSPARRPIQITRDLRGFWNDAYHQVKKELKGRYPKHHWPDDPWQALPTSRTKPGR